MAFDRFNDKPPRREKRDGDNFGNRKGGRFEDSGRERGFGRGEGRYGDRPEGRFGDRKSFGERRGFGEKSFGERKSFGDKPFGERKSFGDRKPFGGSSFREELGGRSGPRAKAVDKRRFSDRAAYASNATVRLEEDVAKYFKSAEEVNAALRLVIELTKTVRPAQTPAQDPAQEAAPVVESDEAAEAADVEAPEHEEASSEPTPLAEPNAK